jgi:hypothetical protein
MTFEEWWPTGRSSDWYSEKDMAQEVWQVAQEAERERIKSRVKEAAENLWCIRKQVGGEPYSLYIGPSLNTLEEFVNRLLEEGLSDGENQ